MKTKKLKNGWMRSESFFIMRSSQFPSVRVPLGGTDDYPLGRCFKCSRPAKRMLEHGAVIFHWRESMFRGPGGRVLYNPPPPICLPCLFEVKTLYVAPNTPDIEVVESTEIFNVLRLTQKGHGPRLVYKKHLDDLAKQL